MPPLLPPASQSLQLSVQFKVQDVILPPGGLIILDGTGCSGNFRKYLKQN